MVNTAAFCRPAGIKIEEGSMAKFHYLAGKYTRAAGGGTVMAAALPAAGSNLLLRVMGGNEFCLFRDDFDLKQPGPELAGHEEAVMCGIPGDSVEDCFRI